MQAVRERCLSIPISVLVLPECVNMPCLSGTYKPSSVHRDSDDLAILAEDLHLTATFFL